MNFTAEKIAEFLNGEIEGDPKVTVNNISKIEEGEPNTLSFLANPKYTNFIYTTKASIVLVNKSFKPERELNTTLIRVEDSYKAFASLLELYSQVKASSKSGVSDKAVIDESATIGDNVYIGALSYIGEKSKIGHNVKIFPGTYIGDNVKIGDNTILYAGVKIYEDCILANDCIIHAGTVIGSDGFGFAPQNNKDFKKIPQIGNVIIEERVEIGANTTIDRATIGSTVIKRGVKIDNLVQIAHNVEIGENTVIAAQSGISGSTKIGKNCMIGGQVGFAGHLKIADGVKIGAQSGIAQTVEKENSILQGSPAIPLRNFYRSASLFANLPELISKINNLEKKINSQ